MQYILKAPQTLNVAIDLPASKSISNRALIIHALSGGATLPDNLSDCDDTKVITRALKDMPDVIDIKAAGTAMRFMTAYLSVTPGTHIITGTERMKHRPMRILVDALRRLGADIHYEREEGYPPLRIYGSMPSGGRLDVEGDISSQYISALLMVGPVLKNGLELHLIGDIISRPYIDLTLCVMRDFGAKVDWTSADTITVEPVPYQPRPFLIENDWSAASYWYEQLVMATDEEAEVRLTGLTDGSRQGDSAVRYLFNMLGVKTIFGTREKGIPTAVTLRKCGGLPVRLDYDFKNQPDMAQTFVVCCAVMGVPFRFTGLSTLKIKETDRIEALKTELRKLGYIINEDSPGTLSWNGERCERAENIAIDTYEDHRMAMAFAPVSLRLPEIKINNPQVVSKSYPRYWEDLRQAGYTIEET